ncbi:MAG: alanine racemase [Acidobacteriota bacterium]
MDDTRGLNSWIELSESAYRQNLSLFRRRVGPKVELSAVVKGNAYGHGAVQIAGLAAAHGADSFCVHALEEAQQLRDAGFQQDVLLLGHVPRRRLGDVVAGDFRLVLFDVETARSFAEAARSQGRRGRVHLKLETGTHRQGLGGEDLGALLDTLGGLPDLEVEGAYTHFANVEDTTDHRYAHAQLERFRSALDRVREAGFAPTRRHAACSAAALVLGDSIFEMVRLGIGQYGHWSSKETLLSFRDRQDVEGTQSLRPVLTWKARISQVKTVPADAFVGYGCTYQTTRPTRLAILPVGYSDGYPRSVSNAGHVLIHGRRAPVRGRVCMNLILVDVTDIPGVAVEDVAVLIGTQGDQEVPAERVADWAGTIQYEILAGLGRHLPRFVVPETAVEGGSE